MTLNYSKCKIMLLSRKHHSLPPLLLESEEIEQVLTYKYLGLVLTTSLKWDDHINELCSRAQKLLGYLYRVFYRNVQPSFLCRLFTSMIRPILEYACQVHPPSPPSTSHSSPSTSPSSPNTSHSSPSTLPPHLAPPTPHLTPLPPHLAPLSPHLAHLSPHLAPSLLT